MEDELQFGMATIEPSELKICRNMKNTEKCLSIIDT